jgi:hypothetical protein
MSDYVDLLTPAQDAVFAALSPLVGTDAVPPGWQLFQHVPENTPPPYTMFGQISGENQTDVPGEQLELINFELVHVWRGNRRRELLQMMGASRSALHNQPIEADGAQFGAPDYVKGEAGEAIADGVTYVGLQNFKFFAQPA